MIEAENNNTRTILESLEIREIGSNTRFWMVRTKKGYFFDEFIDQKFIALGWNIISSSTDMGKQSIDSLKEVIAHEYGDSRPMGSINKCKSFIYEIKKGDYIVIPNNGSTEIAFVKAGEYYEDNDRSVENELEVIAKIDNSEYEISQVKCPYRKRRHIEILNIVDVNTLGYGLRRAISSYHGISCFDKYATDILNGIYDCFAYLDNIYFSVNINKQGDLKPREISRLLYALTEFFCGLVDEDSISTTINLNSPGSVRIKLKNGFKYITKFKVQLICMFLAVTGGNAFGVELPGLAGAIKDYRTLGIEVEQKEVDLEIQKIELESKKVTLENQKIENARMILDVYKQAEEQGIDANELLKQLEMIEELDKSLQFETKEKSGSSESDEIVTLQCEEMMIDKPENSIEDNK